LSCRNIGALCYAIAILASIQLSFFCGCADREELEEARYRQTLGYNIRANEALERAEEAMVAAGIEIDFRELSGLASLADLRTILPDPLEIKELEKQQKIEEAIGALYDVLDALLLDPIEIKELEKRQKMEKANEVLYAAPRAVLSPVPSVPMEVHEGISNSDLLLLHLHLGYCYTLSAVSQLARAGVGPDGIYDTADDLYYISFPAELEAGSLEVYRFTLTDTGQALMDSIDPDVDPYGYIKVFHDEGQMESLQAVVDSLLMLLGAEVAVMENLPEDIGAYEPKVNRQTYRNNGLYHVSQAIEFAERSAPELEDALGEFEEIITEHFAKEILENIVKWGLEVRTVPQRYEHLIE
jgi:hypothetical protein